MSGLGHGELCLVSVLPCWVSTGAGLGAGRASLELLGNTAVSEGPPRCPSPSMVRESAGSNRRALKSPQVLK